ncbi:hypothetical protein EB796_004242 [Bugula neritina]|uniref:Ion transport domain-containing protein n=1 Tax=Bugula neritina TaxID=10212 RepID=A0A7J7KHR7_BUGNE|nr:hypothetical protein EB796_004242 [Bugula neritina]
MTPLHLAAKHGHIEVLEVLKDKLELTTSSSTSGFTALHVAAHFGQTNTVRELLNKLTATVASVVARDNQEHGLTPLHLAAQSGHQGLVRVLLNSPGVQADAATVLHGSIPLHLAAQNGHTAVISLLLSKDTNLIHVADKHGKTGLHLAAKHGQLDMIALLLGQGAEINAVDEFCEQMATDLMAIAASENSPRVLLTSVDRLGLPFLDVLIDCGQKEVVSHPTIQKYLSDVWMGGINWKTWKIFFFFLAFTICPPVWLVLSLPLRHRYCNVPIFKFMSYLVSHVYFIGFLVAVAAIPPYRIVDAESAVPNPIEWMLLLWFSGLLVAELTNPGDRNGLGLIKLLILFLGVAATVTQVVGVFLEGNDMRTCLYIRNQFLGISLTLCFVQILDFLSFHHLFGPWAIIIGSLVIDLVKFVVILAVFMFGFTFYIAAIYQQVYPFDEDASETLGQGNGNANAIYLKVYDVFELLFFSLFGLVDPENLPPVHSTPNWSRTIIKVVFGLYLLISVIVLINLLIAMMSDTYQRIQAQSDTEWKFGRAKLIRNMNKTSSTPSPINLLVKLIIYLKVLIKHKGKVCTASGQQLVDNEEGLNSNKMNADADHSYNSNALPTSIKGTRVAPDDKNVLAGPERVEKAINWRSVVRKYYANKGIENENDIQEVDDS